MVKKEISHEDYVKQLNNPIPLERCVTSIRSQSHQLYTTVSKKKALTAFYDRLKQIDHIHNVPFGYMDSTHV